MFKDCPDVKEFQVQQLAIDRLLIVVVLYSDREFLSRSRIERLARQYMGEMQIEFEVRDTIPLTRSGKRRIIISHLSANSHSEPAAALLVENE
jgi:hypothetical protein